APSVVLSRKSRTMPAASWGATLSSRTGASTGRQMRNPTATASISRLSANQRLTGFIRPPHDLDGHDLRPRRARTNRLESMRAPEAPEPNEGRKAPHAGSVVPTRAAVPRTSAEQQLDEAPLGDEQGQQGDATRRQQDVDAHPGDSLVEDRQDRGRP